MSKETLTTEAISRHDQLTKEYYVEGKLTKEQFDQLHGDNWNTLEKELEKLQPEPEPID